MIDQDLQRLQQEYALRANELDKQYLYAFTNPEYLFTIQHRERAILQQLNRLKFGNWQTSRVLEIGCGGGGILLDFLRYGFNPDNLYGLDLLEDRLITAHTKLPHIGISCADGQHVPFPDHTFDLVVQFTAFSSVLDETIRRRMASEMLRVLRQDGAILWYDFWLNPANPQTRGIRPSEIRALFPTCSYTFRKITLAPPIARRIVPFSWTLAQLLENLKIFNSHYLVLIRKKSS